jgi:hypothetical protein
MITITSENDTAPAATNRETKHFSITDVEVHSYDCIDIRVDVSVGATKQNILFQNHEDEMIVSVGLGHKQDNEIGELASGIGVSSGDTDTEDLEVLQAYLAESGVLEAVQSAADKAADEAFPEESVHVLVRPGTAFGGVSYRLGQIDDVFVVQSYIKRAWRTEFEVSEETADAILDRYKEPGFDNPAVIAWAKPIDE